jgi:signal transduction histidine kinase
MQSHQSISLIEHERLRSVFLHAPLTLSITVINAVLTAFVLAPVDGNELAILFAGAVVIVSLARWIGGRAFLDRARGIGGEGFWTAFSVLGSLASGVLWGAAATVLFPSAESYQLFLALVIGGMCAGAITVNAAHLPSVVAFILPATLPLAAAFFVEGPAWRVSALMIVVFASALSLISVRAHRAFGERVQLQFALTQEQHKLREANERLSEEIAQRQTVEATLHQAQKMEAIGHLTGGIAHDFNNLLQVMIGNMNLIRRLAEGNERVVGYAMAAEQAALRGAALTNSLLTFARRQSLDAERVDINRLLREFEPILLRTLGANIQFEIALATDIPACHADPTHFQSAVLNLVINARDAMPEGGTLSVATGLATLGPNDLAGNPDARPGDFISVSVRDTGWGMTEEVLVRVFEPFFTTKSAGKGTGLGLSQVYGFARQSGGHIGLASKPNEGTRATLWLPVAKPDTDTVRSE